LLKERLRRLLPAGQLLKYIWGSKPQLGIAGTKKVVNKTEIRISMLKFKPETPASTEAASRRQAKL
jgi:hypothetical protein